MDGHRGLGPRSESVGLSSLTRIGSDRIGRSQAGKPDRRGLFRRSPDAGCSDDLPTRGTATPADERADMTHLATMSVARQLGSLFESGSVAGLSDRQLLE